MDHFFFGVRILCLKYAISDEVICEVPSWFCSVIVYELLNQLITEVGKSGEWSLVQKRYRRKALFVRKLNMDVADCELVHKFHFRSFELQMGLRVVDYSQLLLFSIVSIISLFNYVQSNCISKEVP